jgi:O-antigen biosynthesis protein WbqP
MSGAHGAQPGLSPAQPVAAAAAGLYATLFKRVLDVVVSGLSLIFLSPLLVLTAIAIRLEDGGPALFRQERVGRNGARFRIFKFRSMPVDTPHVAKADAAALRITRVGKVIRRTSVDELPQLLNILRGEMSVVGPRPPLPSQTALLETRAALGAMGCKPGLTGWAQINGRDGMPEPEKGRLDAHYAQQITFATDLRIILKTFGYLLKRPPVV